MENKIVPLITHHKPNDTRTEWITPAITDYDIEEATRNTTPSAGNDGVGGYS